MKKNQNTTNVLVKAVTTAMLCAIAFVLYIFEIPFINFGFLKYDLSDIAALIGSLTLGPAAGVVIEFVKNVIHVLVKGLGTTMGFGDLMNFIVGCAFVLPFSLIYKRIIKTEKLKESVACLISGLLSCVSIVAVGALANYFIAPLYFRVFVGQEITHDFLMTYLISAAVLNIIKGGIMTATAFPILFMLVKQLKKIKFA